MANPIIKAWKYLMAKLDMMVDDNADVEVQIEQAIAEAKRQHRELAQQAGAVVGNQRQLEMKLNRQLANVETIHNNIRQALLMAEEARKEGDAVKARDYENAANSFSAQLVAVEAGIEDLKSLYEQASTASQQAKMAVERNARALEHQLAERTKLLNQLDQAKMQEKVVETVRQLDKIEANSNIPNLEEVRDRIEAKYAKSLGATEVLTNGSFGRRIEIESRSGELAASSRLEVIRAEMKKSGELPAASTPQEQISAASAGAAEEVATTEADDVLD